MIQIKKTRAHGTFHKAFANALFSELRKDFTPLIASVKREYVSKLGLQLDNNGAAPSGGAYAAGELYLSKSGDYLYFLLPRNLESLECGIVQKSEGGNDFESFIGTVRSVAEKELKGETLQWENLSPENRVSSQPPLKTAKQEVATAKTLEDPRLYRLLFKLLHASSLTLRDIASIDEKGDALLQTLVSQGLAAKEYVVLCKEKGSQIIKVASREAIAESAQKGLKCFLCGRPISEENVDETASITDLGRKMLEKNYWMSVIAIDAFTKLGLKNGVSMDNEEGIVTLAAPAFGDVVWIGLTNRRFFCGRCVSFERKAFTGACRNRCCGGGSWHFPDDARIYHRFQSAPRPLLF